MNPPSTYELINSLIFDLISAQFLETLEAAIEEDLHEEAMDGNSRYDIHFSEFGIEATPKVIARIAARTAFGEAYKELYRQHIRQGNS